jgi:hypothetical protein
MATFLRSTQPRSRNPCTKGASQGLATEAVAAQCRTPTIRRRRSRPPNIGAVSLPEHPPARSRWLSGPFPKGATESLSTGCGIAVWNRQRGGHRPHACNSSGSWSGRCDFDRRSCLRLLVVCAPNVPLERQEDREPIRESESEPDSREEVCDSGPTLVYDRDAEGA